MSCSGKLSIARLGSSISSNTFTHSSFFPLPKSCSICSQRSSKAQKPAVEPPKAKCTTASTAKLPSMKSNEIKTDKPHAQKMHEL